MAIGDPIKLPHLATGARIDNPQLPAGYGNPVIHSGCRNSGVHNQSECLILQSDPYLINGQGAYLSSDGAGAGVRTGIKATANTKRRILGTYTGTSTGFHSNGTNDGTGLHRFYIGSNNVNWAFGWGSGSDIATAGLVDHDEHEFVLDKGMCYIDGTPVSDLTGGSFTGESLYEICSFAQTGATDSVQVPIAFDIKEDQIWEDDVLVYNAVPSTDGGMFDKISGVTTYNSGTGSLILNTPNPIGSSFWSADGVSFDGKSYQDFADHPNGTDNVYLKFVQDPSCKVKEVGTYDAAYVPDADTLVKLNKYWDVGECGTESTLGFIQLVDDLGNVLVDVAGNELGYYV